METSTYSHLDMDTSELQVVVTSPEYLEQKATIDGIFSLAYGLYTLCRLIFQFFVITLD